MFVSHWGPALRQCHDESDLKTELHWRAEIRPVGDPLSWRENLASLVAMVRVQEGKWIVSFLQVMCQCKSLESANGVGSRGREREREWESAGWGRMLSANLKNRWSCRWPQSFLASVPFQVEPSGHFTQTPFVQTWCLYVPENSGEMLLCSFTCTVKPA